MTFPFLMEWNARGSPLPWEWENIMTGNTSTSEITKMVGLTSTEWDVSEDGETDSGLFSSLNAAVDSGSTYEFGVFSLLKSSKSASSNSLSPGDAKETSSVLEAFEGIPDRLTNKKEKSNACNASPIVKSSVGSSEPLLSLKLGKETYFKDVSAGSNSKRSSHSLPAMKCKLNCLGTQAPHCQVEGCNLDLSSAKDYHRKHRVCENHSKSPKVIIAGVERRFCQQCSRFHGLLEFDKKKRSCRKRLSHHNARRRKPQGGTFPLSAARLHTASYDGKEQISLIWNRTPFVSALSDGNCLGESKVGSNPTLVKNYCPEKLGNINGELNNAGNQLLNFMSVQCPKSSGLLPLQSKCYTPGVLYQGSTILSNMGASGELQRAFSLLSKDWTACEPKHGSFNFDVRMNNIATLAQPLTQPFPRSSPSTMLESWRYDNQPVEPNSAGGEYGAEENHHQVLGPPDNILRLLP